VNDANLPADISRLIDRAIRTRAAYNQEAIDFIRTGEYGPLIQSLLDAGTLDRLPIGFAQGVYWRGVEAGLRAAFDRNQRRALFGE
jgi:hypothetical protein